MRPLARGDSFRLHMHDSTGEDNDPVIEIGGLPTKPQPVGPQVSA
jgi:hypothetical protein